MSRALLLSGIVLWLGSTVSAGCGGDDDDDTLGDGDADSDGDGDADLPPTLEADPPLPDTVRPTGLLSTTLVANDPNGDALAWTIREPVTGAAIDEATGALTVRVPVDAAGTIEIAVDVTDGTSTATFEHSATIEPLGWQPVTPAWDSQTFTATAVDEGRRVVWQVGGFGQTTSASVMRHDLAEGTWTRTGVEGDPLPALAAAGACYLPSEDAVVVAGGFLGHLPREFPRNETVYVIDVGESPPVVHALEGEPLPEALFPRLACHPERGEAWLVGTFGLEGPDATPWKITLGDGTIELEEITPDVEPAGRAYFGYAQAGTQGLLFGGDENPGEQSDNFDDVWTFDLETGEYAEVTTIGTGPSRRAYSAVAVIGGPLDVAGTLVVAGGLSPDDGAQGDVFLLDLLTRTWAPTTITGDDALPFFTQSWAWDLETSTLHLHAPSLQDPERGLFTDRRDVSLSIDLLGATAAFVTAEPDPGQGPRRRFSSLVSTGGDRRAMVVHGGTTALLTSAISLDDTWRIDPETGVWEPLATSGEGPGDVQSAVFVEDDRDRVLAWGGWDGEEPADGRVYALDPDDGGWRVIETSGDRPAVRVGACGVANTEAGTILVFGGLPDDGEAETFELDAGAASGTWRRLDAIGPAARGFCSCAIDPVARRMIVFGGEDPAGPFEDVWALDLSNPGDESWSPIEIVGGEQPGPLTDAIAIGDPGGRKLVVIGGTAGLGSLGDVWMLDLVPGQEGWSLLPWDPAGPEVRRGGGGTWHTPTGSALVFGGRVLDPGLALLNDVWRLPL